MTREGDLALVATLFNKKKVVVEPDYTDKKCLYRYLTQREIEKNTIETDVAHIWLETPIYTQLDEQDGYHYVFSTIEGTPIMFAKY